MYILSNLKISLILCHSIKAKSKNWKKVDIGSSASTVMRPLKPATGLVKAYPIRESAIRRSSMVFSHTDAFKCLLQCRIASRNANSAGEI